MEITKQISRLSNTLFSVLLIASMSMLIACGGSSDSKDDAETVIEGVDGTGYYKSTGVIEVPGYYIPDLQGLVDGKHFMLISVDYTLLFEGTMVFNSETNFTADTAIYVDGIKEGQTTVNGTISKESLITFTFNGSGSFDMIYDPSNSDEANVAERIVAEEDDANGENDAFWFGAFTSSEANYSNYSNDLDIIEINSSGIIADLASSAYGVFADCEWNGSIEAVQNTALYRVVMNAVGYDGDDCFENGMSGSSYTGLATSKTVVGPDDTLVFVFSNNDHAGLADMTFRYDD